MFNQSEAISRPSFLFSEELLNKRLGLTNTKLIIPKAWITETLDNYEYNKGMINKVLNYLFAWEEIPSITNLRDFANTLHSVYLSITETISLIALIFSKEQYLPIDVQNEIKFKIASYYCDEDWNVDFDKSEYNCFWAILESLFNANLLNQTNLLRIYSWHRNHDSILPNLQNYITSLVKEEIFNQKTFDFSLITNFKLKATYTKKLFLAGILDNTKLMQELFCEGSIWIDSICKLFKILCKNDIVTIPYLEFFVKVTANRIHFDMESSVKQFKELLFLDDLINSSIMELSQNGQHIEVFWRLKQIGLWNKENIESFIQNPESVHSIRYYISKHLKTNEATYYNHKQMITNLPSDIWECIASFSDKKRLPKHLKSSCHFFNEMNNKTFKQSEFYNFKYLIAHFEFEFNCRFGSNI